MTNVVAIIPARAGSKGIVGKNLISICGKPLIAWSIRQALEAERIDSVWVSSDGDEILKTARMFGAQAIKRPASLSTDTATSESAWIQAIDYIEETLDKKIDIVVGMQATSPVREKKDLNEAIELFCNGSYDSLLSVSEIEDFFVWEEKDGNFRPVNYDYRNRKPRQLIEKRYRENGSFYLFRPSIIRKHQNRLGGKIGKYVMDFYKMFQIDNLRDVKLCEVIMKGYGLDNS